MRSGLQSPTAKTGKPQTNTEGVALAEFQRQEVERWQKAVRDSGAKAD